MTTTSDRAKRLTELRQAEQQTSENSEPELPKQSYQRKLRPHEKPLTPEREAEFEAIRERRAREVERRLSTNNRDLNTPIVRWDRLQEPE